MTLFYYYFFLALLGENCQCDGQNRVSDPAAVFINILYRREASAVVMIGDNKSSNLIFFIEMLQISWKYTAGAHFEGILSK